MILVCGGCGEEKQCRQFRRGPANFIALCASCQGHEPAAKPQSNASPQFVGSRTGWLGGRVDGGREK